MSEIQVFTGEESLADFETIADLHKESISGGFLASLNTKVLIQLYLAIAQSSHSRLLVCRDEKGKIQGFICVSFSTSKLYKEFLVRKSFLVLPYLVSKIVSLQFIRKVYEVLVYPVKKNDVQLPDTEVLNFCVERSARGKKIGTQLFTKMEEMLREREVSNLKIVTGENQKGAQNFYEKRGAVLLAKQEIHKGVVSYIYQYSV